jgi:hypothetical protein
MGVCVTRWATFPFSIKSISVLRPTQTSMQWVTGGVSPVLKRQGREADHSPLFSAISSLRILLHAMTYNEYNGPNSLDTCQQLHRKCRKYWTENRVWGFQDCDYEVLGCDPVYSGRLLITFRKDVPPVSWGHKREGGILCRISAVSTYNLT